MELQFPGEHEHSEPGLSAFQSNLDLPRHRWFEFKEGFSETLVRSAIGSVGSSSKTQILDPFAGSGTTVVTAAKLGVKALGLEVNPFLAFAGKAKCAPRRVRRKPLEGFVANLLRNSTKEVPSPLEGQSTFTESETSEKWLFNRSVLRGFHAIHQSLARSGELREPFRLALLSALVDSCNAKRDGKCLRYKRHWKEAGLNSEDLRAAFIKRSADVIDDLLQHDFWADKARIIQGDCRNILPRLYRSKFDLLVTSPPYLNSFDYSDVYRPELFAGGFVKNNDQLRAIRLRTLRSHVQVAWKSALGTASPLLKPIIKELSSRDLWNKRLPAMVNSYFADLKSVLRDCKALMRKEGQAWIVVSNSAYAGIEIPVDLIVGDIAERLGWKVLDIFVIRKLRASAQHWNKHIGEGVGLPLRESLLVLSPSQTKGYRPKT
jgi:DNA modification methylase